MKRDCFAYVSDKKCNALYETNCCICNFYKPKKQYLEELSKLAEYSPLKGGNRHLGS